MWRQISRGREAGLLELQSIACVSAHSPTATVAMSISYVGRRQRRIQSYSELHLCLVSCLPVPPSSAREFFGVRRWIFVALLSAGWCDTDGRAGGRCSVKASKRVVLEKQQNGILFMKRPPARWSSSQDLKQSLSSQKEKSSTNHEAPPISRDPRRVVRAGRLPLLPRRPRGGEFFFHERSGGRPTPTYIRPLARSMIHLDNTHSTAIISCVLSPLL